MNDIDKVKDIVEDICKLVTTSANGLIEKNFEEDPKNSINTLFLKRYYYSLVTISKILDCYQEDKFFHFPICLILRSNILDFLIQCKFICIMREDASNIIEIKRLLADHFNTLKKDKEKFKQNESRLKEIFSEFADSENGELMKGELSAYKIYEYLRNDNEFSEDSMAYEIYNEFSKIEHFGAFTPMFQDESNGEKIFDRIIEAIKYVRFGIQNSLINIIEENINFSSIDLKINTLREKRFSEI